MARLSLRLLGGFQLRAASGAAVPLPSRKARALVAYLGLRPGRTHPRDALTALLWGDTADRQARHSLRQTLLDLRRALGSATHRRALIDGEELGLESSAIDVDVAAFERLATQKTPESLERAAALYQGDLLKGLTVREAAFEEWLQAERERLREMALASMGRLLDLQARTGPTEPAIRTAVRLLSLDPLQEAVHRTLMRLYERQGRRATALRQYQVCVSVLQRELGVEPEAATKKLYRETLQQQEARPAVPGHVVGGGARSQRATVRVRIPLRSAETPLIGRTPSVRSPGSPPTLMLVGREAELQHLHGGFAQARNGARQIVFITGEPGIGKTTVVEAFLAQVAAGSNDLKVAQGQCVDHYGVGEAYLPILEALERLGRALGNDALRALLYRHAPTWLMHLPSLITPPEREELQRQLAGTGQERMLRELAQALETVTKDTPLVLWLEDLHWSDQATLVLLTALARRTEPARLMILGTYRPADALARAHRLREVHQELQLHGYCTEIALQPLSATAVAEYIARQFAVERTPAAFLQRVAPLIHQRTEGNPLFMINVLDHLVTQGVMVRREGSWKLAGTIEQVSAAMPTTIRQFLDQQLDRLSPADQGLLEAASVAGVEFSAAAVAAGVEATVPEIEARCTTLGRHGQFLQVRGSEEWPDGTVATRYGFLHALYHDVLYERVAAGRKVALHRRIGERHEHAYGNRAHELAAELAMHFERGHDYSRAGHYRAEAGKQALQRSAHHEAISHLTTGRELLNTLADTPERAQRELSLQITLGTALMATKGFAAPEVEAAYVRARELCQQVNEPRQLCAVLWGLRTYYNGRAEFHTAREVAEQLLAVAQRLEEPALLVEAHRALGNTLWFQGEVAAAYEHFAQGIALYDLRHHRSLALLSENDPGVGCLCFAAVALWHLGYPDRARHRMQAALQLAQDVAHLSSQAMALALSAALHRNLREVHATRERADTLIALARTHGFSGWLANGTIYRGWALAHQGQADQGLQEIREALMTLRTAGIVLNRSRLLMALAEASAQAGKPAEGLSALTESYALMQSTGGRLYQADLYRLYGELALRMGAAETREPGDPTILSDTPFPAFPVSSPEAAFQTAIALAHRQQAKSLELRAVMSLARLWQRQGKGTEARNLLAPVYGWFTEGFDTADLQEARALLEGLEGCR